MHYGHRVSPAVSHPLASPPHAQSIADLLQNLNTNLELGLCSRDTAARRATYGANRLQEEVKEHYWHRIASRFYDPMIGLLAVAAITAGFLGEPIECVAILAIVILNGLLSFLLEDRAHRTLEALQSMTTPTARVRRDGRTQIVRAEDLVPGDVMEVEAGDHVAADARLAVTYCLQAQEASLTGESNAVEKSSSITIAKEASLADRQNMIYAGTQIVGGKALAIVTTTGMATEIGVIAGMLQHARPEPTPLQIRLAELGHFLLGLCLAIVAVLFTVQWCQGGNLIRALLSSTSLAVAIVPEGLPAVVTIVLAIGLNRMAKKNAIIRKLPSVETLGCVSVICTDKTGTLTGNEMTVTEIRMASDRFQVSGSGYSPQGAIVLEHTESGDCLGTKAMPAFQLQWTMADHDLSWLLRVGAMCNNAKWEWDEKTRKSDCHGDPTEIALLVVDAKAHRSVASLRVDLLDEHPFDSQRKMMSQVYRLADDRIVLVAKGAPEVIVKRSFHIRHSGIDRPMQGSDRQRIADDNMEMAAKSLRVLGVAYRVIDEWDVDSTNEENLTFLGLVGMNDPPRPEVFSAISRCVAAGIKTIMITGDHPATAMAIAKELGIAHEHSHLLTGHEMRRLTDQELFARIEQYRVFARVSPEDKHRIVRALRSKGEIVAMTGDGVNDAPAVESADIGIAMGIAGTDVTKKASDMILVDDNFATIVNAVEEGRGIYENIQKFLHFLLAGNSSEVLFMFACTSMGGLAPLGPIQILWINLVTDGLPALSLAMEPIEKEIMQRPPRNSLASFLPWSRISTILLHGMLMASPVFIAFFLYTHYFDAVPERSKTVAFCTIALTQSFFSMACRSFTKTIPQLGLFSNLYTLFATVGTVAIQMVLVSIPATSSLLASVPLDFNDWLIVFGLALIPVTLVELAKVAKMFMP